MYTPAKLVPWAIQVVAVALVVTGSISQAIAQPGRSCPVGGYAITACPVISDEVIRDRIASRLAGSVASSANAVSVEVCNGVVTLRGQVESEAKRDLACFLVACVPGVVGLNNYLTINPRNAEDLALMGRIKEALRRQPVDTSQVRVEVSDGVAQLSGMVRTEDASERAAATALGVPGVTAVYNNITVVNLRDFSNW